MSEEDSLNGTYPIIDSDCTKYRVGDTIVMSGFKESNFIVRGYRKLRFNIQDLFSFLTNTKNTKPNQQH